METKLKWGLLASGNIANAFAKGVLASQNGQLVAVGSRSQDKADKFADKYDIPNRHGSYEALLADPQVQAVYISTPHPGHAEWAIKAAEAGKHILCEKPLTMNASQTMAVIEAARQNDVFLMEAFMYRCHPQTEKLRELLREKAIGDVRLIQATFSFNGGPNYEGRLLRNELGGGGILDVGCYAASMARLIAGHALGRLFADPIALSAQGHLGRERTDEWAIADLKFENDIVAQLSTGVQLNQDNSVRIYGSDGWIYIPSPWFCGGEDGGKIILHKGKEAQEFTTESGNLYGMEADAVAANIEKREAPQMSPDDTLGNMKTLDQWRKAIGLVYDEEKPENYKRTMANRELEHKSGHKMKYGRVQHLDKDVSRLVFGCDNQESMAHASAVWDDWFEHGGNAFDTGHIYGGGYQEKLLGQWIKNHNIRNEVTVIVKGAHSPHCNPQDLTKQLHISLDRLQFECADIYFMHRDNLDIPVADFIEELNSHVKEGRIKAFGGSNWSLNRVQEANDYAESKGLQGFSGVSNNFSLARMVDPVWAGCIHASDANSRAWFERTQLALMPWSSQARGFFVRGDRNFTDDEELTRCWYADDNFARLERVQQMSEERGWSPINIALAYILNQPFPTFPLIGPRAISETHSSLGGLDIELTPNELKWLNLED